MCCFFLLSSNKMCLLWVFCVLRQELEDLELKHNSNIKQLMREVNTQMALKEKELDTAVKETIGETAKYYSSVNMRL